MSQDRESADILTNVGSQKTADFQKYLSPEVEHMGLYFLLAHSKSIINIKLIKGENYVYLQNRF